MINKKIKWRQLSNRQRMSPFPNYMSMEAITQEMKKIVGVAYCHIILIFEKNNVYVFVDTDDYKRVGEKVFKKVKKEPDIFVRLLKKQKKFEKSFLNFIKKNNKPNKLKKISHKKLAFIYCQYEKRYKQIYSHYFPVLSAELNLFNYLRNYIYSKEKDTKKAARYLDKMITERKAMVNWQERRAALKICQQIEKNKKWKKLFLKSENTAEKIRPYKKLYNLIKKHEKRFFWITRDYEDPILTFDDFIKRFKNYLKNNPKKELKKMLDLEKHLKAEIKEITSKLKIDKKHQRLFKTMREGIFYKEYRKSIVSKSLYYFDPVLKEIARRAHLSLKQVRYLVSSEIEPLLTENKEMCNVLNQRIKLSVFYCSKGKSSIYTGQEAKKYYDYLMKFDKNTKELTGLGVSPGQAKGKVKIVINPDQFYKVEEGDIIATLQATPVFGQVLKKASALICDGGPGITSHPATLAREFNIPGIIQLKAATKILKDGQEIEVDGDSGIVKILK